MRSLLSAIGVGLVLWAAPVAAQEAKSPAPPDGLRLEGPILHDNLAVYIVRGRGSDDRDFITLAEGLAAGTVIVTEQGAQQGRDQASVNWLVIENRSDMWVFIQAGDVVKGGKQDRTIGIDLTLAPRTGPQPIQAFCVEHGRWTPRAGGGAGRQGLAFQENLACLSSNALKKAVQGEKNQGKVWEEVAKQEEKAAKLVAGTSAGNAQPQGNAQITGPSAQARLPQVGIAQATAPQVVLSATGTYNAIVAHEAIRANREAYLKALLPQVQATDDALGVVVAVNGKLMAADVYASPALFRKLSQKLLDAYALEAVLAKDAAKPAPPPPPTEAATAFLRDPEKAESKEEAVAGQMTRQTSETHEAIRFRYIDASRPAAAPAEKASGAGKNSVHLNVLSK